MTASAAALRRPSFRIDYGVDVEPVVSALSQALAGHAELAASYQPRWLAIKLLEGEADLIERVRRTAGGEALLAGAEEGRSHIEALHGDTADIAIADARYGYVHGVVRQVLDTSAVSRYTLTDRLDRILTHRLLGLPIFFVVMYVVFKLVVDVSAFFLDWVDAVVGGPATRWVSGLLTMVAAPDWFISLAVDGVVAGVGAVLVFVPGLIVLYLFLTLLEDSGYMARVAFVMDRVMRFTGLHGKSFMPMILGFGCAVPAVYSTRTLENRNQRLITSLLVPLMSCSARLPVYVVFGLAFFGAAAATVITGLYLLGIVLAASVGIVLSRTILRDRSDSVFALELPPYRMPTLRALATHTWQKTKEFVVKAGTVILAVSIMLWFLMSLPWGVEEQRDSYFGQVSAAVAPAFAPAGFGTWEASGALVTGFIAKEVVVATMAQAYVDDDPTRDAATAVPSMAEDLREMGTGFVAATDAAIRSTLSIIPGVDLMPSQAAAAQDTALSDALAATFTPLAAVAFVIFVLIYTPCVATLSALRSEFGWRWAAFSGSYQLGLAWLVAVIVFQAGTMLGFA
ncbi:MAG TPA: ferrous iron transport protein B [Candidatus Limnocylindrales bacterium]|nr:ferrous iron transport protein B [Candidatus Limnocylindrales bacterium]